MKRFITVFGLPIFMLAGFFIFTNVASAATLDISTSTVWHEGEVIVSDGVNIMASGRLTVERGVVIKMNLTRGMVVAGNLVVNGTLDQPVIITSIKDDSIGGDSNGDGSLTSPVQGDFQTLKITATGNVVIDYAQIKYGGGGFFGSMIEIGSSLKYGYPSEMWPRTIISNSLITESANYGILDKGYRTIITKNIISHNNNYGIRLQPNASNEITYNDIGYNGYILPTSYWGGGIYATKNGINLNISYNNFHDNAMAFNNVSGVVIDVINNWWGSENGPLVCASFCRKIDEREVIIGGANYMPFLTSPFVPVPPTLDPVIIVPGALGSWQVRNALGILEWEIDPIFHVYDNLMEALISAGYKEHLVYGKDRNLFVFPYDWRVDNNVTAQLLKDKIQEVKDITGKTKVDIVAHSMGGIVTRAYVEGSDYQNDIDRVIFLGTPHLGSPECYLKYEGADGFFGREGSIMKFYFQIEAASHGYLDLTSYLRDKVPTVQQLLPAYSYLQDRQIDDTWQYRSYPTNHPVNTFLDNLNTSANVNLLRQRVRVTNIFSGSSSSSTLSLFRVVADPNVNDSKWPDGYPENLTTDRSGLIYGKGDDTVPYSSANGLTGVATVETTDKDHLNLPTTMQRDVIEVLTGHRPADYFNNKITATIKRWLFIRVYSPVDFVVTTPEGKKIGKDFTASMEINQIGDAFYSGFDTDTEFVLIPNPVDGDYKVELQGVDGGGEYTLASSFVNNNQSTETQVSSQILNGAMDSFTVNLSGAVSTTTIESDIDFEKLIDLTSLLYQQQEITKDVVKTVLVNSFTYLSRKYDKIITSHNKSQKRLQKLIIKIELKVVDQTLQLYAKKGWLTTTGKDILTSNINLLVDKL